MIHTASTELCADFVSRREAKIGNSERQAVVETKHILGLKVSVVYTQGVAVLNSFQKLEKDVLDEAVVAEVSTIMKYH